MSFIVCQIQPLHDDCVGIHQVRSLALGGEQGLLARVLPGISRSNDGNWTLTVRELLMLDNPEIDDNATLLFDMTPHDSERKILLRMVDVCGRTMSLITDALFHFKVLTPVEAQEERSPGFFAVEKWEKGPDRYEQMRLEGGFVGGSWAWTEPPLALGATVLHPSLGALRHKGC